MASSSRQIGLVSILSRQYLLSPLYYYYFNTLHLLQEQENGERTGGGGALPTHPSSELQNPPLTGPSEVDSIISALSGIDIKPIPEVCPW